MVQAIQSAEHHGCTLILDVALNWENVRIEQFPLVQRIPTRRTFLAEVDAAQARAQASRA